MKRFHYNDLINWKLGRRRKPLLVQGARQVGKTFLVEEFGRKEFADLVKLNFEQDPNLRRLFIDSLSPKDIIKNIGLYFGKKIDPKNTLLFFDEVQVVPEAITSLKYFFEQVPEYYIIAAGSLLGVRVGKPSSFPVGKVNFLTMKPMNFFEFLIALNENILMNELSNMETIQPLPEILHEKLLKYFKLFLFLGGMPEVLQSYIDTDDISLAREIQIEILESYNRDFSKYSDHRQSLKISEIWQSIPYQLAKENKKFKYSDVRERARASMYELAIQWLKDAGLIYLAYCVRSPRIPLSGYRNLSKFKVYLLDTGLLAAMLNLTPDIIIHPSAIFSEFNGAFIENYVASELINRLENELYYWRSNSDAEVDFLLQGKNQILPVEVKSGLTRNIKSLRSYEKQYGSNLICRLSPRNFTLHRNFLNIPLYGAGLLRKNEFWERITSEPLD